MPEFVPKNLGNGELPSTKGTLYSAPADKTAIVRSIVLVNKTASAVTVNIYGNFTGTSRHLIPKDMQLQPGARYDDDMPITLDFADYIEGDASSASAVDFVLNGVEAV